MNHPDNKSCNYSYQVGAHFRDLHMLMDLILSFGDDLLKNFLAMHRSVSSSLKSCASKIVLFPFYNSYISYTWRLDTKPNLVPEIIYL